MSERDDSVDILVESAQALDDEQLLTAIRTLLDRRPQLAGRLGIAGSGPGADPITDADEVELPDTVVEVDEIIDVPVVASEGTDLGLGGGAPAYTDRGVPTFDSVRERIEGRFGTSVGSAELAHDSSAGKSVEE